MEYPEGSLFFGSIQDDGEIKRFPFSTDNWRASIEMNTPDVDENREPRRFIPIPTRISFTFEGRLSRGLRRLLFKQPQSPQRYIAQIDAVTVVFELRHRRLQPIRFTLPNGRQYFWDGKQWINKEIWRRRWKKSQWKKRGHR